MEGGERCSDWVSKQAHPGGGQLSDLITHDDDDDDGGGGGGGVCPLAFYQINKTLTLKMYYAPF